MGTDKSTYIVVDYGIDVGEGECSGVLFEVPNTELVGGDVCEIRLWGLNSTSLSPYYLMQGTTSMGSGESIVLANKVVSVVIDFAETFSYQCEWPVDSIVSVIALNEIVILDDITGDVVTWASKGDNITSRFAVKGQSCITQVGEVELYGSVTLTFNAGTFYKRWYWPIPTGAQGLYWFFIYKDDVATNKFSIQLPDLADGTAELRNIAITVFARDSEAQIEGAYVYIDGLMVGQTDSAGVVLVEGILQGTHSLKIIADGFLDTDIDGLYNDELRVY